MLGLLYCALVFQKMIFARDWIFTGSKDGEVKAWSMKGLTTTHTFKMKYGSVFSLTVHVEGKDDHVSRAVRGFCGDLNCDTLL